MSGDDIIADIEQRLRKIIGSADLGMHDAEKLIGEIETLAGAHKVCLACDKRLDARLLTQCELYFWRSYTPYGSPPDWMVSHNEMTEGMESARSS